MADLRSLGATSQAIPDRTSDVAAPTEAEIEAAAERWLDALVVCIGRVAEASRTLGDSDAEIKALVLAESADIAELVGVSRGDPKVSAFADVLGGIVDRLLALEPEKLHCLTTR
ncbi:MAG: hypothetical protein ACLQGP_15765 [Isosphaeraceae bacterium]